MTSQEIQDKEAEHVTQGLADVKELVARRLSETSLKVLLDNLDSTVSGKMLRSRLIFHVGSSTGAAHETLVHAAAAVEMVHAASLLHDDVIDGGFLRRHAPTFWVEKGVPGAILVGDLLLFKALDLLCEVENARLSPKLIKLTGEVCDAESEQELVLRGTDPQWENCVSIARRKTGALFAFAGYACGGTDQALCDTLETAGYAVGTAYQLADDILDANGSAEKAGKSLGSDQAREKTTAVTSNMSNEKTISYVNELCDTALASLAAWPDVQAAWQAYIDTDLRPALKKLMAMTR